MLMKINKNWFTFVELIVVVSIIAIISTLWFLSYSGYLSGARDSQRKSDIAKISSSLKLYKQKRWIYPTPWTNFNLLYSWTIVWIQWLLNNEVTLTTIDKVPNDPYVEIPYFYSITQNKQEFQLSLSLENWDNSTAVVGWDYKTVSKNILPNIIFAIEPPSNLQLDVVWGNSKFIFDSLKNNLPYDFDTRLPYSDGTSFTWLLNEAENSGTFWQNSDYRSCEEIEESWKSFWDAQYQILNNSWALTSTGCVF